MTFELTKMTKSRKKNLCLVSYAGYVVILSLSGHIVRIHDDIHLETITHYTEIKKALSLRDGFCRNIIIVSTTYKQPIPIPKFVSPTPKFHKSTISDIDSYP